MNITYTFPPNCPITQLRGKTLTGGIFCNVDGTLRGELSAVLFEQRVAGKRVIAKIAGKPELEAAFAEHKAAKQAKKDRLVAIGWPEYERALRAVYNAQSAYDAASEYGYPAREAEALRKADEALAVARETYPLAAAYSKADSYSLAENDVKSALGRKAKTAIEAGEDPNEVVATMDREWSIEARRLVDNS